MVIAPVWPIYILPSFTVHNMYTHVAASAAEESQWLDFPHSLCSHVCGANWRSLFLASRCATHSLSPHQDMLDWRAAAKQAKTWRFAHELKVVHNCRSFRSYSPIVQGHQLSRKDMYEATFERFCIDCNIDCNALLRKHLQCRPMFEKSRFRNNIRYVFYCLFQIVEGTSSAPLDWAHTPFGMSIVCDCPIYYDELQHIWLEHAKVG